MKLRADGLPAGRCIADPPKGGAVGPSDALEQYAAFAADRWNAAARNYAAALEAFQHADAMDAAVSGAENVVALAPGRARCMDALLEPMQLQIADGHLRDCERYLIDAGRDLAILAYQRTRA